MWGLIQFALNLLAEMYLYMSYLFVYLSKDEHLQL